MWLISLLEKTKPKKVNFFWYIVFYVPDQQIYYGLGYSVGSVGEVHFSDSNGYSANAGEHEKTLRTYQLCTQTIANGKISENMLLTVTSRACKKQDWREEKSSSADFLEGGTAAGGPGQGALRPPFAQQPWDIMAGGARQGNAMPTQAPTWCSVAQVPGPCGAGFVAPFSGLSQGNQNLYFWWWERK